MAGRPVVGESQKLLDVLAENCRLLRIARGLKQSDLADRIGVHRLTILRLESAECMPAFDVMCNIADELGIRVDRLRKPLGEVTRVS